MRAATAGFTLVELAIAVGILLPLLGVLASSTSVVVGSLESNAEQGELVYDANRAIARVERMLRSASAATMRRRTTSADVEEARRNGEELSEGQWVAASEREPRSDVQLTVFSGSPLDPSGPSEDARSACFTLDESESANGRDDDGDGLVDEGQLEAEAAGQQIALLSDVESFSAERDGRLLTLRLSAVRQASGRTLRTTITRRIYLRNP